MDKILMKFIVDKFKKENDISADICNGPKYAKHRIKMLPIIEKARKNLTTNSEVDVQIEELDGDEDFEHELTL